MISWIDESKGMNPRSRSAEEIKPYLTPQTPSDLNKLMIDKIEPPRTRGSLVEGEKVGRLNGEVADVKDEVRDSGEGRQKPNHDDI